MRSEERTIDAAARAARRDNSLLALLRIPVFRRVWAAIALSSLGDWLGLLATTAMAQQLTAGESIAVQGTAISGVILTRLLPDLLLGAFAGALADRLDRRKTVVIGELLAASLYLSIAIGYDLLWLYVAQFLIEAVGLFTMPAKQALWVNIVPRKRLAVANQLSLLSVYGAVPVAALLFALLNTASRFFADARDVDPELAAALEGPSVTIVIALGFNALSFVVSAGTIFFSRHKIPAYTGERERSAGLLDLIKEGVAFLRSNALMKALYVGILGAFAAGGFVIGVAQLWVATLAAGTAGYSLLFGSVFTGLALGMLLGPRLLPGITRRRIFGVSIGLAGILLIVMSFLREFVIAAGMAGAVGFFSGVAWIIGYTLIGYEVADRLRGRTFAFVISSVRIILLLTVAIGPLMAGFLGNHVITVGQTQLVFTGPGLTLLFAGILAFGVSSYVARRVAPGQRSVITGAVKKLFGAAPLAPDEPPDVGFLCAVEGPDPVERRRVAVGLVEWLRAQGHDVVLTGRSAERATEGRFSEFVGPGTSEPHVHSAAQALLAAAAHAEHVATVIRPVLERAGIVVCDGFHDDVQARSDLDEAVDTSEQMRALRWGSGNLVPHLTVVLDDVQADQDDLRQLLIARAHIAPDRYLVVPAERGRPIPEAVRSRVHDALSTYGLRHEPSAQSDNDARGPSTTTSTAGPAAQASSATAEPASEPTGRPATAAATRSEEPSTSSS
ncbi:MAG: MFS transporter [Actinomycetota bacterium]|nr:MFS transporter [Actinomycetota bacterium]